MKESWGLHWFRRDLRVAGNPALHWNLKKNSGRVLGFFCFDPEFLSRPDFSVDRFGFFLKSLEALRDELREGGGDLLVMDHGPKDAFPKLLSHLKAASITSPQNISFNRDYEPFARDRDEWVQNYFSKKTDIEIHTERDHLLIEPHEILKENSKDRNYYSVYTPFSRKWFEKMKGPDVRERISAQKDGLKYLSQKKKAHTVKPLCELDWATLFKKKNPIKDCLDDYVQRTTKELRIKLPEAGSLAAFKALENFIPKINEYNEDRDRPNIAGTSQLSIYFKNGSLTTSQVLAYMDQKRERIKSGPGPNQFVKELAWREFYYHILWHRPDAEHGSFQPQYRDLPWENNKKLFKAWTEGKTGYPIVDAGMRQLNTTGWMHNRVRMIVASFLTKDLLIDWRWGEKYFMERLLDGDLAPNNGGWQWAASTGCDPQPYFRIFNPELQSRKFDPDGEYLLKYVPELASLAGSKELHAPQSSRPKQYPERIVDHGEQRQKAIKLFKSYRK